MRQIISTRYPLEIQHVLERLDNRQQFLREAVEGGGSEGGVAGVGRDDSNFNAAAGTGTCTPVSTGGGEGGSRCRLGTVGQVGG